MSEPVLSRKRQGAQDAVDTLETFEAFEAFDKHGLPAFSAAWMLKRSIFFLALFRTGTLPRAAEQLGISLSSANRMLAKLRTYWDDPLFVRSGFLMQPTTAAKRRYDKVLSLMHVLEDLLDLVFFARQGLHPDIHSAALLTTPYVCLVRRGHPLSERAAALGPLEREDLEAFPQVLINA